MGAAMLVHTGAVLIGASLARTSGKEPWWAIIGLVGVVVIFLSYAPGILQ